MVSLRHLTTLLLLAVLTLSAPVTALVTDLSNRRIEIRYSFQGADLILFGAVGNTPVSDDPNAPAFDVVVVVRGPELPSVVRRKRRVSGIWVNAESITFPAAPGYYAVAANRSLEDIAEPLRFAQAGIGFENLRLAIEGGPSAEAKKPEYMQALNRLKSSQGLYRSELDQVAILDQGLFRTNVRLPATVPVGEFFIDTFIFQDGDLKGRNRIRMDVGKEGFERAVYSFARDYPFFYGLTAVIIALGAGWLAGVLGKK